LRDSPAPDLNLDEFSSAADLRSRGFVVEKSHRPVTRSGGLQAETTRAIGVVHQIRHVGEFGKTLRGGPFAFGCHRIGHQPKR
jgi:hypothetical protein